MITVYMYIRYDIRSPKPGPDQISKESLTSEGDDNDH